MHNADILKNKKKSSNDKKIISIKDLSVKLSEKSENNKSSKQIIKRYFRTYVSALYLRY